MKKGRSIIGIFLFLMIASFLVVGLLTVLFQNNSTNNEEKSELKKESLHIVAIGDSLTQGVGDTSNSGGYVPIVADLLKETDNYKEVTTSNYGKSGDRSDQILERFYESKAIQEDIASADIVVLTVGGNDIIQILKQHLLTVTKENFLIPEATYRENLTTLLSAFKKVNPEVQLYIFGIYNPYSIYFPEITEMESIAGEWNETTKEVVNETENATFLPIADLFNPSLKHEEKKDVLINEEEAKEQAISNPYLYEEDLFHPNEAGYQLMSEVLFQAIVAE
ncbi:Lipase/Acylhydrolase, putative [Carnobacterium sp. AT7]|uniref:SGNH/GDSL hydrolase family protein n=1 Tax=Carnobacterium sp. AT7 TaxID=333990 RepID=UPI00015F10AC|nr:SGNH/GDSL hydrolase family protein [Carnobacterium sp. AT7]EDP67729.1 Lipase/Acylhydrolase, putative [Carnobacterium sp. AT7]